MAVILWAVGGAVVGAIAHDDHSAHSDYDNYGNYSNYSDYAERQKRRLASLKSDAESSAQELSRYKRDTVNDQLSSQTLKEQTAMRVSPDSMNSDVHQKISRQIEFNQTVETSDIQRELDTVNELIARIDEVQRENR